jgi:hypothetical protein
VRLCEGNGHKHTGQMLHLPPRAIGQYQPARKPARNQAGASRQPRHQNPLQRVQRHAGRGKHWRQRQLAAAAIYIFSSLSASSAWRVRA